MSHHQNSLDSLSPLSKNTVLVGQIAGRLPPRPPQPAVRPSVIGGTAVRQNASLIVLRVFSRF